jgi:hypothetical protein
VRIVKRTVTYQNVIFSCYETSGLTEWLHPELLCFGVPEVEARKLLKHCTESVTKGKMLAKRGTVSWQDQDYYCAWMPVIHRYILFPPAMAEPLQFYLKKQYDYTLMLN